MRRVLRPGGQLLFVEHGLVPEDSVRLWQERLTPLWKRIGGGCHLNRGIAGLIEAAGLHIDRLEPGYMKGPKPMSCTRAGRARNNTCPQPAIGPFCRGHCAPPAATTTAVNCGPRTVRDA